MNILVLQPTHPKTTPQLRARAAELLARMVEANPGMAFDVRVDDSPIPVPPHPSLYMRHATVRNYMLDTYLRPEHDAVLWIDSDLVDYPADLPALLHESAPGAIVAPLALLDASPDRLCHFPGEARFYDIGGFIEGGRRCYLYPPYFLQEDDVIELDSVGCCYLAPASLYRLGVRYEPPPTDLYVEHWSVCQAAWRLGYKVYALTTAQVIHAWLPDYGMDAN